MNYLTVLINKFLHIHFLIHKRGFLRARKIGYREFYVVRGHLLLSKSLFSSCYFLYGLWVPQNGDIPHRRANGLSLQFVHLHLGPGSLDWVLMLYRAGQHAVSATGTLLMIDHQNLVDRHRIWVVRDILKVALKQGEMFVR